MLVAVLAQKMCKQKFGRGYGLKKKGNSAGVEQFGVKIHFCTLFLIQASSDGSFMAVLIRMSSVVP